MQLSIDAYAPLEEKRPSQIVRVSINGVPAGEIRFDGSYNRGWRTLQVPPEALSGQQVGVLQVTFEIDSPILRRTDFGMGLIALRLDRVS